MFRISLPRNPNPWSGVAVPLKRATNPVVRRRPGYERAAGSCGRPRFARLALCVTEFFHRGAGQGSDRLHSRRSRSAPCSEQATIVDMGGRLSGLPRPGTAGTLDRNVQPGQYRPPTGDADNVMPAAPVVVRRVAPRWEPDSSAASATPYGRVSAGTDLGWGAVLPGLQPGLRAGHDGRYS